MSTPLPLLLSLAETAASRGRRWRRQSTSLMAGLLAAGALAGTANHGHAEAVVSLASLDGLNGSTIVGAAANARLGNVRAQAAGDINGDGRVDLIANYAESNNEGAYVIWGRTSVPQWLDLAVANTATDRTFYIVDSEAGDSVAGIGDINNDGFADFAVADSDSDGHPDPPGVSNSGSVYVVFGSSAAPVATFNLTTLNGTNGFQIHGVSSGDRLGLGRQPISGAGDVNGDGFGDFVISASYADGPGDARSNAGEVYLIFGRSGVWAAETQLTALTPGTQVVTYFADTNNDRVDRVAGAGDVNGDGLTDFLLGAPYADGIGNLKSFGGEGYLIFGRTSWAASYELTALDGTTGVILLPVDAGDRNAGSLAGLGDVNGDGLADVILGAELADGVGNALPDAGDVHVVFGRTAWTPTVELSTLNGTTGFIVSGIEAFDSAGFSCAPAGDFNGDGYFDILFGARNADGPDNILPAAGEAFVLFGRSGVWSPTFAANVIDGTNGFRLVGPEANMATGSVVGSAGDWNNDGVSDLLVGSPNGDAEAENRANAGELHIVYGSRTAPSGTYRTGMRPNATQFVGIGRLENGGATWSESSIFLDYPNGTGPGIGGASMETVQRVHTVEGLVQVSRPLSLPWHLILSNDRTGDTSVVARIFYSDADAAGLIEANIRMFSASSPAGPWSRPTAQSLNAARNFAQGTVTLTGSPVYLVLSSSAPDQPVAAPTAVINTTTGNPTANELIEFTVDFDQSVVPTFTLDDVQLAGTLAASSTAFSITGPNASHLYTVRVVIGAPTTNGTIGITIPTGVVVNDRNVPYAGGSSTLVTVNNSGGVVNCADMNKDGSVNVADVTTLANHIVNGTPLP